MDATRQADAKQRTCAQRQARMDKRQQRNYEARALRNLIQRFEQNGGC